MIIKAVDWQRKLPVDDIVRCKKVSTILHSIENNGDTAIEQFSQQFDGQSAKVIKLKSFDEYTLEPELANSIKFAADRIEKFARFQKQGIESKVLSDEFGTFSQQVSPIERAGIYIPGGRYPLISTALMTLIPAKVAGTRIRIACSPSEHPALLAAASLAGATQFIQLGGVQAIGALAFGFKNNRPADVIVGPGNAWVNEAKKQISNRIKIDGLAGPSELLAICDKHQPIEWLALDALAQAEHDPMACSLIVSDDIDWLQKLQAYLQSSSATQDLLDNNQIELIVANSVDELITFSENYAPEHLMLCHKNISENELSHYGSLFIGANSAVALGDYISGPNHTLPTLGFARQNGGLNVQTFLRYLTVQTINDLGRKELSAKAIPIAKAEGLNFHLESLKIRQ